jgi:hypothetical protein
MTRKSVTAMSGRVTTEGDNLYFEVRGQKLPLLMIAGGGTSRGSGSADRVPKGPTPRE